MFEKKNRKISATGVLSHNMMVVDDHCLEWIDAKDFSLAALARTVGIDDEHNAKATITIEIVEQPCELCGQLATGNQLCDKCQKLICDQCAKTDATGRYCPICFDLKTKPDPL